MMKMGITTMLMIDGDDILQDKDAKAKRNDDDSDDGKIMDEIISAAIHPPPPFSN